MHCRLLRERERAGERGRSVNTPLHYYEPGGQFHLASKEDPIIRKNAIFLDNDISGGALRLTDNKVRVIVLEDGNRHDSQRRHSRARNAAANGRCSG